MTPYVIRIRSDLLRTLLCIALMPYWALRMIVIWSLPVAWGGHPDGWRIFAPDAWAMQIGLWCAAVDGEFVDAPRS